MRLKCVLFFIFGLMTCVQAEDNLTEMSLDMYLAKQGIVITEGYVTSSQKVELIKDLKRASNIKKILEIGFNAGHSAELFLTKTPCEKLISFDINVHTYTAIGAEFIKKKFGQRFALVEGDSKIKVPEYAATHGNETFDLIFIDGGHSFDCCFSDIQNCSKLAHKETLVLIDDYSHEVKRAVDQCVNSGLIVLLDTKQTQDILIPNHNGGERIWVAARYLNNTNPRK